MMRRLRHLASSMSLAFLAASLAACGGGDGPSVATQAQREARAQAALERSECSPQAMVLGTAVEEDGQCLRASPVLRASAVPQSAQASAPTLAPDVLFNWAEAAYPALFPGAGQPTQTAGPYTFRHYPGSGNYLGVAGEDVYVMGTLTAGIIARVGSLSDFSCAAAQIGCIAPGAPIISGIDRGNGTATVYIAPPDSTGSGPISSFAVTCVAGLDSIRTTTGPEGTLMLTGLLPGRQYACMASVSNAYGASGPSPSFPLSMPSAASFQQTKITLVSDAGDYIGAGASYAYTLANASISASASGAHFRLNVQAVDWWSFDVVLPAGMTKLAPGTYTGLTRYPFHGGSGGLDWSGSGRGCNTLTGSVTIASASYSGGELDAVSLTFTQHCEGSSPALHGTVIWGANDTTTPPGPVNPIPANLWKPESGALPATGNYVYLKSDAGDYIGQGKTSLYTGSQFGSIFFRGGGLSLSVADNVDYWSADFVGMSTGSGLQVGYYGDLARYPFQNPTKGGLSWSGSGRGCNTLSGWFAIDELAVEGNTLKHLLLRFEQHCEGGGPALRGQVRWSAG